MQTLLALLLIFLYEAATAVVLPTPNEIPVLSYTWIPLGWIFVFAVAGKILGSYLVFFLGDRIKTTDRFRRLAERSRAIRTVMAWSERFVNRYSVLAIFILLSVPGFPDTVSLYLLALVGKRPVVFALAAGLGTGVRMLHVLFGLEVVFGLHS